MATYPVDVLIRKWSREELSLEQAIGQILLVMQKLDHRIKILEGRKSQPQPKSVSASRHKKGVRGKAPGGLASHDDGDKADVEPE